MASMASRVRNIRDAEPSVQFRAPGEAAVATANTFTYPATGLPLNTLEQAIWDNKEIPWDTFAAQIVVNQLVVTTNEVYTFSLEVSDGTAFSPATKVAELAVDKIGSYVIEFDAKTIEKLKPGVDRVRLKLVTAGTAPDINFHAWAVHVGH